MYIIGMKKRWIYIRFLFAFPLKLGLTFSLSRVSIIIIVMICFHSFSGWGFITGDGTHSLLYWMLMRSASL